MSAGARTRRRTWTTAIVAALAIVGAGVLIAPHPPTLSHSVTGDRALASVVRAHANVMGYDSLAVAEVTTAGSAGTTYAGFGAGATTEFEIGSVTKTFTSLLLAQAVQRHEVRLDTRVGTLLDLGHSPAADVTLEDLATHRSGLPRVITEPAALVTMAWSSIRAQDPYPGDLADLLAQARSATLTGRGTVNYSNLGVALLGQALAAATHSTYATLLRTRILDPLELHHTRLPASAAAVGDGPRGATAAGRPEGAWTMGAYAPAGAIRSTVSDLATYTRALLTDDPRLGIDTDQVLDPRFAAGTNGDGSKRSIGLAWFTSALDSHGRNSTWHDGETGGFASMIALDRARGTAVIILGNTTKSPANLAFDVLDADGAHR